MTPVTQIVRENIRIAFVVLVAFFLLLPTILAVPVSADRTTSTSIKMDSSVPGATAQEYTVGFTTATTSVIQGIVIEFCSNSPIIATSCTAPSGMAYGTTIGDITGLNPTTGWSATTTGSRVVLTHASGASVNASTPVTIEIGGFTNPNSTGTFYARIVTYDTPSGATDYTSTTPGTHIDDGGVALSTTTSIGVTASVHETLTFCVSAVAPSNACAGTTTPNITLGHGSPATLDTSAVDTATVHFQLSTNAAGATAVAMRGDSADLTSGSNTIPGVGGTATTITAGTAGFGMRSTGGTGGTGSVSAQAPYNGGSGSQYGMDSSVTSTYGDQIATASGPVLNVNTPLIFAATAGATTPAGVYTASFSLVATSAY